MLTAHHLMGDGAGGLAGLAGADRIVIRAAEVVARVEKPGAVALITGEGEGRSGHLAVPFG